MNIKQFLKNNNFDDNIIELSLNAKRFSKTKKLSWHESRNMVFDIDLLKKLYLEYNLPVYKIAMLYGFSDVALRDLFIRYNIPLKKHCVGKNSQNTFFEKIDTKEKAYFLGLIAADGCVMDSQNTVAIELKACDKYILEKFIEIASFNAELLKDDRNGSLRYRLSIHSKNMVNHLKALSIMPRKSTNNSLCISKKIPEKLIRHFIRGYFDGDGIAKKEGYVGFCGSETIIKEIHSHLIKNLNLSETKITYNKWNGIYYIQWGKKEDTEKLSNYFYKDSDMLFLKRKYNKVNKRLNRPLIE